VKEIVTEIVISRFQGGRSKSVEGFGNGFTMLRAPDAATRRREIARFVAGLARAAGLLRSS
jgi:hypothetical protein